MRKPCQGVVILQTKKRVFESGVVESYTIKHVSIHFTHFNLLMFATAKSDKVRTWCNNDKMRVTLVLVFFPVDIFLQSQYIDASTIRQVVIY